MYITLGIATERSTVSASNPSCSVCGTPIEDELPGGDSANRKPCPKCGSTARTIALQATATVTVTGTAQLTVVTYPEVLLKTSKDLLRQNQYGISIVVAHMACEVAAERSLSTSFSQRGLQYLEESVLNFLNGYNLATGRNRKLYVALTGDNIHEQGFWQAYTESATRRNNIIHKGAIYGELEAKASIAAATAFVSHLVVRSNA